MPQPYFVPMSFNESRSTHNSGVSGSTSTVWAMPLTIREIDISLPPVLLLQRRDRYFGVTFEDCWNNKNTPVVRPGGSGQDPPRLRLAVQGGQCKTAGLAASRHHQCDQERFMMLKHKVAIVTGAAHGIGLAISRR